MSRSAMGGFPRRQEGLATVWRRPSRAPAWSRPAAPRSRLQVAARLAVHAVNEQNAIEMIHLVLDGTGEGGRRP
jgi:hypothetical protein